MQTPAGPPRHERYTPLGLLGRGGHATVWRVRDHRLDVERACKRLDAPGPSEKEARTHAALDHPHVVTVVDTFIDEDGHACVVMELMTASLADAVVTRGTLSPHLAVTALLGPLDALAAAHRAGVVHRDVKPSNLLIDPRGAVKVSDFGVARVLGQDTTTRTGAVVGTLAFMAPEQREDPRRVTPAADVYAVGATLLWLVRGEVPVDPYVPEQRARWKGAIPDALRPVIERSLSWSPNDRFSDAAALAEALRAVLPALDDPGDTLQGVRRPALASPPAPTRAAPRRSGAPWALLAVVSIAGPLLGLGIGAWNGLSPAANDLAAQAPPPSARCPQPGGVWSKDQSLGPRETVDASLQDLDADGHLDALYVNQLDETLTIRWGDGTRNLGPRSEVSIGRVGTAPAVGDLDEDGVPDLIVARSDDAELAWLRGLGGRQLADPVASFQSDDPRHPQLIDWDGDGHLDLLVRLRECVAWRRGDGRGALAPHQCLTDMSPAISFSAGDLTGDGAPEIAVITREHRLQVWHGRAGEVTHADDLGETPANDTRVVEDAEGQAVWAWTKSEATLGRWRLSEGAWRRCDGGPLPETTHHLYDDLGDIDGNGTLDAVSTATCAGCTSNHILWTSNP